jgi:hypothetical protein
MYENDPATGYPKWTSAFELSRKFTTSEQKTFSESLWSVFLGSAQNGYLFHSVRHPAHKLRLIPPNQSLKLLMDVRQYQDRLLTGHSVQINDGAGNFSTVKVYLKFTDIKFQYQTVVIPPQQFQYFVDTPVLGTSSASQLAIEAAASQSGLITDKSVDRRTVSDVGIVWQEIANGAKSDRLQINYSQSEILPDFFTVFVTKMSHFTLAGLSTTNWDLQHWAYNYFERVHITTSGGQNAQPDFMRYLQGSDLTYTTPGELELQNNYVSGQLVWDQNSKSQTPTTYVGQLTVAKPTWIKLGYKVDELPAAAIFSAYTNPSAVLVRDAGSGRVTSELQAQVNFKTPIAAADFLLMSYYVQKANVVTDIVKTTTSDRFVKYTMNNSLTGAAFE